MKLILTSFGVSHLARDDHGGSSLFYKMPPVSMSWVGNEFMPDYAALLLADQIILDKNTYTRLIAGSHWSYGRMALMMKMLHDEGFVRLEDFDAVVRQNRSFLERVLERDLEEIDLWLPTLGESCRIWSKFMDTIDRTLRHEIARTPRLRVGDPGDAGPPFQQVFRSETWLHESRAHIGALRYAGFETDRGLASHPGHRAHRRALKEALAQYLAYVNANLLLCDVFECGFHDWHDFAPFYREKFMRVAKASVPGEAQVENVQQLFNLSFPEFTFWDPTNVLRALKDPRIAELRDLVDKAVKGEVAFDREFALRTLQEVLRIERSLGTWRILVSYLTLPLGFIPLWGTVIQKGTEEAIARPLASMKRKGFQWFYLISQMAERHRRGEGEPR